MKNMELEIKEKDNVLVVKSLEKNLEAVNSREFKTKLVEYINQGKNVIVINLSKVEFIDSSGLGSLISILKMLSSSQKGGLAFCEIQEPVKRIFTLTRLNQVFPLYSTEEEAIKNLKTNSSSSK